MTALVDANVLMTTVETDGLLPTRRGRLNWITALDINAQVPTRGTNHTATFSPTKSIY
ncbi:hypothetical protein DPMN_086955 [Dreissena polymorpha]|uniref:Uncharacterized protein n=1 Tax=Dreissena polymorpha TaxID=45954 RepID=A0A9D4QV60_DREPO|nr:hypothetical protein DPMN_086955 [Dreissena polymorpha]